MSDKFDRYREALVVEARTSWPDEFDDLDVDDKSRIEQVLHADASNCAELEYVRMHTGFCRHITVTKEDVERARSQAA